MFNPYESSKKIKEEFVDYIKANFPINNANLKEQFAEKLESITSKGPYLDIKPVFETGYTIKDMIGQGKMSPLFEELEKGKTNDEFHRVQLPLSRPLYLHQIQAVEKAKTKNLVVTTGTGSGKTECFLLPILNELLEEKAKNGFISDKVKVVLIYPMNALANDQLKRLRNILMYYPSITFGSFTGETEKKKADAEKKYADLHGGEGAEELRVTPDHCGLSNEIKSRDEMIAKPPHILITNYAMLERMLLIRENDVLFRDSDVRFVVLDEAHVYQGASGMETSLLIRRLLARISQKPKFILTSATLGEQGKADDDICAFAKNLTSGEFDPSCIIYGKRKISFPDGKGVYVPPKFFLEASKFVDNEVEFKKACEKYQVAYDSKAPLRENIYDICSNSALFESLKHQLLERKSLITDVKRLPAYLGINDMNESIAFIFVCSFGEKNKVQLLDSRYHFFLRALEGCFFSFSGGGKVFLSRKKEDEDGYTVFEAGICKKCGDLTLYGKIDETGHLVQKSGNGNFRSDQCCYFHLGSAITDKTIDDAEEDEASEADEVSDDEYIDKKGSHKITKYWLCPKCGKISEDVDGKPGCDCGVEPVAIYSGGDYQGCLNCKAGKYTRFYVGGDAATGVIGAALFEELPSKDFVVHEGGAEITYQGGKQFLAFSDSRSEAAYFASYMDKSYEVFLRRRAIYNVLKDEANIADISKKPWDLEKLVKKTSDAFYKAQTFKKDIVEEGDNLQHDSDKNAWYGVLTELCTQRKRNSLSSLGVLSFEYSGLDSLVKNLAGNPNYGGEIGNPSLRPLLNQLIMTVAYWGAVDPGGSFSLHEDDLLFIYYSKKRKFIIREKEYVENSEDAFKTRNISSWLPRTKKNKPNEFIRNSRYVIASKILGTIDAFTVKTFLNYVFDYITKFAPLEFRMACDSNSKGLYYFPAKCFVVKTAGVPGMKWWRCKKCGFVSAYTLDGRCPIDGCGGEEEEVDVDKYFESNHYRNMYANPSLKKLYIKEHTAQIASEVATNYQTDFEKNRINALSCSTTFEMGVDLGSLETVFLRDVPPNPSNYIQRSGRAGRSKESSAYTLTYAKLSSHDFNYFNNPLGMITGRISPPRFKINNEKIVLRHIYAVVLAYLFKDDVVKLRTSSIFSEEGIEKIRKFLKSEPMPSELTKLLSDSFAGVDCAGFTPEKYDWVDKFIGEQGALTCLANNYLENERSFKELINDDLAAMAKNPGVAELARRYERHSIQLQNYQSQKPIDILARGNVLPKYGFPVDVVELDIGDDKVELSRDMTLALSEYAPGETVIANGKKYLSRYIKKKLVGKNRIFAERYFCLCPNCKTYNYSAVEISEDTAKKCSGCGETLSSDKWEKSIIPEEGFVADSKQKGQVSIANKPEKIYASEACYVGDNKAISETKYLLNGHTVGLKHTENDEIMVVSKTAFYVCPACGYAYGVLDAIKNKSGKKDKNVAKQIALRKQTIEVSCDHENSHGHLCQCHKFQRYFLTHVYKTDVVQMSFDTMTASTLDQAYSVMTALLDAMSDLLDIERNDVSGCVKMINNSYGIILFDTVPGGAGHVKRLLDADGGTLSRIVDAALKKMESCSCGSSCYNCLRSYYNQKYHDILDRNLVIDFLKDYRGPHSCLSTVRKNPIIENALDPFTPLNNEDIAKIVNDELVFCDAEDPSRPGFEKISYLGGKFPLTKPTFANFDLDINDKKFNVLGLWKAEKTVLVDSEELYGLIKDDSDYQAYLISDIDSLDAFLSKIRS